MRADGGYFGAKKIGFAIRRSTATGNPVEVRDLRQADLKGRPHPRPLIVPAAIKRASGIAPQPAVGQDGVTRNHLGRTAGGRQAGWATSTRRSASRHLDLLADADDPGGLVALRRFLGVLAARAVRTGPAVLSIEHGWTPISCSGSTGHSRGPDPRSATRRRPWSLAADPAAGTDGLCLVTGRPGPGPASPPDYPGRQRRTVLRRFAGLLQRRGVRNPTGKEQWRSTRRPRPRSAFKYGGRARNRLLDRGEPRHRLGVGDATGGFVFWADANGPQGEAAATAAEGSVFRPWWRRGRADRRLREGPRSCTTPSACCARGRAGRRPRARRWPMWTRLATCSGVAWHRTRRRDSSGGGSGWSTRSDAPSPAVWPEHHRRSGADARAMAPPAQRRLICLRRATALQDKTENVPPLAGRRGDAGDPGRHPLPPAAPDHRRSCACAPATTRRRAGTWRLLPGGPWRAMRGLRLPPGRRDEFDPTKGRGVPVSLRQEKQTPSRLSTGPACSRALEIVASA